MQAMSVRTMIHVAILACVLMVVLLVVGYCAERGKRERAEQDRDMAEGRTTSAVEAINEIGKLNERGEATDAQVEQAHEAIRQANPADRDAIARHELCRLQQRSDCNGL